jgi:carboxypeptidase family protein/TonB-dependent receptor-like protein
MPNNLAGRIRFGVTCLAGLLTLSVNGALGQSGTLRGIVSDSSGYGLPNAEIRIQHLSRVAHTDSLGRFTIPRISSRIFELSVRRLGYEMKFLQVAMVGAAGDSVNIVLSREPVILHPVQVDAPGVRHPMMEQFEERRERGIGTFLTAADFKAQNSTYPSDTFRRLPGMKLVRAGGGFGVRFVTSIGMRRAGDCAPMIWVDGQRAQGLEIDDLSSTDIQGVEIYRGTSTTPGQYATSGATQCGTILVWTRRK